MEEIGADDVPVEMDLGRRRSSVRDRPPTPVKWAKVKLDDSEDDDEDEDEYEDGLDVVAAKKDEEPDVQEEEVVADEEGGVREGLGMVAMDEDAAATKLQGRARIGKAKKNIAAKREEKRQKEQKEQNLAATKLQGRARINKAKKQVGAKKEEKVRKGDELKTRRGTRNERCEFRGD